MPLGSNGSPAVPGISGSRNPAEGVAWLVPRRRPADHGQRHGIETAADLVERDFNPPGSNRLWVADITDLPAGRAGLPGGSDGLRLAAGSSTSR